MAVVKINCLDPQSLQALVTRLPAVLRTAVDHSLRIAGNALVCELGSQEDLISLSCTLEPFADQIFRILVDICGIPEVLSEFVRAVEDLEAFLIRLDGAVEGRETHGSETKGADLRAILAELAGWELRRHVDYLVCI